VKEQKSAVFQEFGVEVGAPPGQAGHVLNTQMATLCAGEHLQQARTRDLKGGITLRGHPLLRQILQQGQSSPLGH